MPRRRREKTTTQEEKGEVTTPHNQARRKRKTSKKSHHVASSSDINPLLKIVFIHRVLRFIQPKGIIVDTHHIEWTPFFDPQAQLKKLPRYLQLRQVNTNWSETIDYYSSLPSGVVRIFCRYIRGFLSTISREIWERVHVFDPRQRSGRKKSLFKVEYYVTLVRDAFLWISKFVSDPESAKEWCHCVFEMFESNEEHMEIFGTEQVRDAFVAVAEYATSAGAAGDWCFAILWLCQETDDSDWWTIDTNRELFGTTEAVNCFVSLSKFVSNSCWWCEVLSTITELEENQDGFGTEEFRDAMIFVSESLSEHHTDATQWFAVLKNLTNNNESNFVHVFGTEAMRDAILSAFFCIGDRDHHSGVYSCCHVISLFLETNPTLFCVEQTVEFLVELSKIEIKKKSLESIYWFLKIVLTLLHSDRKLFDTTEIRNVVEKFQEVLNDPDQVKKLETDEEYLDNARQWCVEFQKIVSEKSEASSSAACAD